MMLSAYYSENNVLRDGEFITLGYVDSPIKGTLTYCDNILYLEKAKKNINANCIITTHDLAKHEMPDKGVLISPNPRNTFYKLHQLLLQKGNYGLTLEYGIGNNCSIHPSAIVSSRARIGNNVTIAANVIIKDGVSIDDNTFIDAGVVIGCEGLLYTFDEEKIVFIKHAGGVKVGRNVTILSHAIIAKSVHDSLLTVIGDNSIIGISTNVGHEAQIGNNCVISSNCVIARRARLRDGARIGPSSTIREHVKIGKHAQVKLGSIVVENVKEKETVSGYFALNHIRNLRYHLELKRSFEKKK
jgi:UDP-3-O-[3-hydroxymyristoyl] glucosamine N-acyltransferase